jgi:hypothetical protein
MSKPCARSTRSATATPATRRQSDTPWRRAAAPLPTAPKPRPRGLTRDITYTYELRLHRARGYGALKGILDILADEEPLTLTEIAQRLQRTPGSTKDYLSWLEDVDLVTVRHKRYTFADPLLRLWVRLHCRPEPPEDGLVAQEVQRYAFARLPQAEPALVGVGRRGSGIIEID